MRDRLAQWLYTILEKLPEKSNRFLHRSVVYRDLQTLDPTGDVQKRQKEYELKKLSLCGMVLLCGMILSLAVWIKEGMDIKIAENQLTRNVYGEGVKCVTLIADNGEDTLEIALELGEKEYTREELQASLKEFLPRLEGSVLGENESFDKVSYDLKFVDSLPEFPFTVEWWTDGTYIDGDGRLVRDKLESPQLVEIAAEIYCGDFRVQHVIFCHVHTKEVQPDKSELLTRRVNAAEQESREEKVMTLPSEFDGKTLRWSGKRSYSSLMFLMGTPILMIVLYFGKDRDLHNKVADREEQLRIDYPELVSTLALLIGAGMTVSNAWKKAVGDYLVEKKETKETRYVYEEMLLALYEIQNGVSQPKAYERFGKRCRIASYNRLAAMLSQNIRKGSTNLVTLLREEAQDAFEERKHMARKIGEKAGTKLLAPMMLMLCMIMVIIMIPALTTYF